MNAMSDTSDRSDREIEIKTCPYCGDKIDPDPFFGKIHLQNCKLVTERKLEEQSHKTNLLYSKQILHNSVIPRIVLK